MKNIHLLFDFVLIIFCISFVRDSYKNLSTKDMLKSFKIRLSYSWLVKLVLFFSYFFGLCSFISMMKNDNFSTIQMLDILVLISITTSFYLLLPHKIVFFEKGIIYNHKIIPWSEIHNVDIYGNKIDILFNDFTRKIIELDKISLSQEKTILQICYNHDALM